MQRDTSIGMWLAFFNRKEDIPSTRVITEETMTDNYKYDGNDCSDWSQFIFSPNICSIPSTRVIMDEPLTNNLQYNWDSDDCSDWSRFAYSPTVETIPSTRTNLLNQIKETTQTLLTLVNKYEEMS